MGYQAYLGGVNCALSKEDQGLQGADLIMRNIATVRKESPAENRTHSCSVQRLERNGSRRQFAGTFALSERGWDNIAIFGWLGPSNADQSGSTMPRPDLRRQTLCDSVLFLDVAQRTPELRQVTIQEWLSCYFKSPMNALAVRLNTTYS